jgi:myo-inositol-1(or 4)-monophosphatase
MAESNTGIVDRAVEFAVRKHSGSVRKGTQIPYILHTVEAAAIVAGMTEDQELIAAAVLHDTLEDTETTYDELEEAFGRRVAKLVEGESEDKQQDRPAEETWKERKQATLDHLKDADLETRILMLGDKLSNIRAVQRDLKACTEKGEPFWQRFHQQDSAMHGWYYGSIAGILLSDPALKNTQACREYAERVKAVFGTDC